MSKAARELKEKLRYRAEILSVFNPWKRARIRKLIERFGKPKTRRRTK